MEANVQRTLGRALGALALSAILGCGAPETRTADSTDGNRAAVAVAALFAECANVAPRRIGFPKFGWEHVEPLLERADDPRILTRFPMNPFSSQSQSRCSVGILALWLIEGVRRELPGGFPSNNPLCLGPRSSDLDWIEDSERNRPRAAALYRDWWERVRSLPPETRAELDPLSESELHWH